jgi:hypothetical protein
MESEIVYTGSSLTTLLQNKYLSGDTIVLKYRHAATQAGVYLAAWNDYTVAFNSLGYIQVRVENS